MKRIEFIAPVEAMRGNLSGKQKLEYPTQDNAAYAAPDGKQYARNYQPRFIGAKRQSDGLKTFSVRTKSATTLTAKSRKAMAILGAAGAIYAAFVSDKTAQMYTRIRNYYDNNINPAQLSFRKWVMDGFIASLKGHYAVLIVPGPLGFPMNVCNNPFEVGGTSEYDVTISNEVLVKFWDQIASDPIVFTVGDLKAISHSGDSFETIASSDVYNVLGLHIDADNHVEIEDAGMLLYQEDGTTVVVKTDVPVNGDVFVWGEDAG